MREIKQHSKKESNQSFEKNQHDLFCFLCKTEKERTVNGRAFKAKEARKPKSY